MRTVTIGRARTAVGLAVLAGTAIPLQRHRVGRREEATFRLVNDLPDSLFPPAWTVMQGGALGTAGATAALAYVRGQRQLALRLATGGSMAWGMSKVVKRLVRRGRPGAMLEGVRHRGKEAGGLGYLSGHAAVSVVLAATAVPYLSRRGQMAVLGAVPLVGLARVYVGAHLPLDVVAGAAMGIIVEAALMVGIGTEG